MLIYLSREEEKIWDRFTKTVKSVGRSVNITKRQYKNKAHTRAFYLPTKYLYCWNALGVRLFAKFLELKKLSRILSRRNSTLFFTSCHSSPANDCSSA